MPNLVPNYLTTDAAGNVGANFSGHISALGVDLFAWDAIGPATISDRQVRWLKQSDGSAIATIYARQDEYPGEQSIVMGTAGGAANVTASNVNGGQVDLFGAHAVDAVASGNSRVVIDELGRSDFPQLGGAAKRIIEGPFNLAFPALTANQTYLSGPFTLTTAYTNFAIMFGAPQDGSGSWFEGYTWGWAFDHANKTQFDLAVRNMFGVTTAHGATLSVMCIHD